MAARDYQIQAIQDIRSAWEGGHKNILYVLATGGGKTFIFSTIIKFDNIPTCVIAHRQELVTQISVALARQGVRHKIIGPDAVIRNVVNAHMTEVGKSFFSPDSIHAVAGIDTLVQRGQRLGPWLLQIKRWVMDEAHHLLIKNKWGKGIALFPNAVGLGVTASPERADGYGLSHESEGVFDAMIVGPPMRWLINNGFLTDYRLVVPPIETQGLDLSEVHTGATGDYVQGAMVKAFRRSRIVGEIVPHYKRFAEGKRGVTFVPDVESAHRVAALFKAAGVPAEAVHAGTPEVQRTSAVRRLKNGALLQLVNVDLFGEGFDLPAIEVISMARPSKSLPLIFQQFGRALRVMQMDDILDRWETFSSEQRLQLIANSKKPKAIIIDHVSNILDEKIGLPDKPRQWSLAGRKKNAEDKGPPLRSCPNPQCLNVYERIFPECPYCGYKIPPQRRSSPQEVDGDLMELSPEALAALRGEIVFADRSIDDVRTECQSKHMPLIGQQAACNRHHALQESQTALRNSIALWAGHQRAYGRSDSESYRRFFFEYGVDVLTAQTFKPVDANMLRRRIETYLENPQ